MIRRATPVLALLVACAADPEAGPDALPSRTPGERMPLTADCDDQDLERCILPFPSSRFTQLDPDTETGLRLAIEPGSLLGAPDDPTFLNTHDGFSRITPVMTAFDADLDSGWIEPVGHPVALDAPVRLYNAQPDHPDYGVQVPVWAEIVRDAAGLSLVLAHPLYPLAAGADHVVVITDELVDVAGASVGRSRDSAVALGLASPEGEDEAELSWYHGPTRELLAEVGLPAEQVVRAWDFTTRSDADLSRRMLLMLDGVRAAEAGFGVEIDRVQGSNNPDVAMVVEGRVTGVPDYLTADDRFVFDETGLPTITGERDAVFRVLVPAWGYDGSLGGTYRVSMYGHGTGGDVHDDSMDATFAVNGVAKVGIEFGAWNGTELFDTFGRVMAMNQGVEQSTGQLVQSLADGYAVYRALHGPLRDALTAETIGGEANPAAGRALDADTPLWTAGSLGGSMGAVIGASWPEVDFAALNVPGGAWSHFIPHSYLYSWVMEGVMETNYGGAVNARIALAYSQGGWDDVDGACWGDIARAKGAVYLMQESVGDPVMPNVGTELLARSLQAAHVGVPITTLPGIEPTGDLVGATGLTQFSVPPTGEYDVHGFAARDTPAGDAAMEQIFRFARAAWAGESEIVVPSGCATASTDGSCDFSDGDW